MGKFLLIAAAVAGAFLVYGAEALSSASCPTPSRVASCSPQCKDSGCLGAQVCCTNICGTKSCTDLYQYQDNKGAKGASNSKYGSTGTYCGNVKCSPGQKCELDRSTKREKCVRG